MKLTLNQWVEGSIPSGRTITPPKAHDILKLSTFPNCILLIPLIRCEIENLEELSSYIINGNLNIRTHRDITGQIWLGGGCLAITPSVRKTGWIRY